jgi:hypothetical protein
VNRAELVHVIRAACDITHDTEVYVFGSQAILGQFRSAPDSVRMSVEPITHRRIGPIKASSSMRSAKIRKSPTL